MLTRFLPRKLLPLTCLFTTQLLTAANLLHHWSFDDGSGSVITDSIGAADLVITPSDSSGWVNGQDAGAFQFNGGNHAISSKDAVIDHSGSVAIAGWLRTTTGTSNRSFIFEFERLFGMRIRDGGFQLSFNGVATTAPIWGEGNDDGLWHHFVAQSNGSITELYIDGRLIGSRAESLASLTTESKYIALASKQSGQKEFKGYLDDVRYYDGTLSTNEIRAMAGIANIPPTAHADAYAGATDEMLVIAAPGVLSNDTDLDGDTMTASLTSAPAQGTLNLAADGSFTYDPPAGFVGELTFAYQAIDKDGSSSAVNVTLTILDPDSSLTTAEITQIETALGITLTEQEILDLAALVKPQSLPGWRNDAALRIEAFRKANLTIDVVDSEGNPVPNATVQASLRKHAFKFGGVVTVMDQTDASGNLSNGGMTINQWEQRITALFYSVGLNNGFKPKIVNQHQYIPGFLTWAENHALDVRGHLLIWPGDGDIEDLDTVDASYGSHLSTSANSAYATHDVYGALETYKASARTQTDKDTLEAEIDAEILEWVSQWDVYEWDVINETLNNYLLMDILGYDQMTEWFNLAEANRVNANAGLFINDYQVISAKFSEGSTHYQTRRDGYFANIDTLLADSAPVTGIGFQSRFKYGHIDPALVYTRLEEFATRYPTLDIAGTEFEIKDYYDFFTGELIDAWDEQTRAQMTEEILTVYFSHPQVTGMNAWDVFNPRTDHNDPTTSRAMFYYDGEVKLNALVWYYLHRIRYHTDATLSTDANGQALVRGFKGEYDLTVNYGGNDYPANATLNGNSTLQIQLDDVTLAPATHDALLEHWAFDDISGTQISSAINEVGNAVFTGNYPNLTTNGAGQLVITQHPSNTAQFSGDFITGEPLTIGPRSTGKFELDFTISSADLTTGDANGAAVGIGVRDSTANLELFLIRLNKTVNGLAISTYIDATYTQLKYFSSQFAITEALRIRSLIDLDTQTAEVFLTEGVGAEVTLGTVALNPNAATLDQIQFVAQNNQTDWGATDNVAIDSLSLSKLEGETFATWSHNFNWGAETQTAMNEDPDRDGVSNFLEFAFGGDPLVANNMTAMPHAVTVNGAPYLRFTLGSDSADLIYLAEYSTDLIDWTTIPSVRLHGAAGEQVEAPLMPMGYPQAFCRINAEPVE